MFTQEAVRTDSLDQGGSADDLADSHLTVPAASSTPPRQRSSSVHTLKYNHPQRTITCRSPSESARRDHQQAACDPPPPERDVQTRAVSPLSPPSLQVPSGGHEPGPSVPPGGARTSGGDLGVTADAAADEEVSRITSAALRAGSPSHKSRHLSPGPGEHRGRLSQSVSPVSGRNWKERMSPPPGEEPPTEATQLLDSSVELRRRTLSFDATTSLLANQSEGSPADD